MNATFSGKTSRFKLIKTYDKITSGTLIEEVSRRKLSYDLVNEYLYQVFVIDRKSQRKSIAFAFPNILDHYEVTIPNPRKGKLFKTSITQNAYTLIEGEQCNCVEIFSDAWDFLTWLTMMKHTVNRYDAYILNGKKNLPMALKSINSRTDKVKTIMDFSDNKTNGDMIREQIADFAEEHDLRYGAQNYLFAKYKSLSDYWMNNCDAQIYWT